MIDSMSVQSRSKYKVDGILHFLYLYGTILLAQIITKSLSLIITDVMLDVGIRKVRTR